MKVEDVIRAKLNERPIKLVGGKSHDVLELDKQMKIEIWGENLQTKIINFVLMIPLYIHVESVFRNKGLYQRNQISIINMKDATNFHNFPKRNN